MHLVRIYALGQWLFYTPFQCTLPRTFTYQACPFSVHCLSFNALPAKIRTRNHGISTVLMFLRINLITNWGKFCTCSDCLAPPSVCHMKMGHPVKCPCPRTQQASLPACSPHYPIVLSAKQRSCQYHFSKSFGITRLGE